MLRPLPDFDVILAALDAHGVRFVLIGGLAMQVLGSDHRTEDIDIFYAREKSNLTALASALAPYKPRLRGVPDEVPFIFDAQTFKNTVNMTLDTGLGAIDLLGDVAGAASFEDVWQRTIGIELYGVPVRVVSLDDLIAMKRAAGRPKDKLHLTELLSLRRLAQETGSGQV